MKTTGTRSLILYIVGLGFLFGLGVFLYGFAKDGGNWAVQPFNRHVSGEGGGLASGRILDRNGEVIAQSVGGKRVYGGDAATRRAMLHVVGDSRNYISTGVQYNFRSELSGYNPVTGLVSPTGKPNGNDIRLTLDSSLCKLAVKKFGSRDGAAVLYNYRTGELLCMVSAPGFDPQKPPADLTTDKTGKYEGAFLNKALSSTFTPGSVFKVVTAAAAIDGIPDLDSRTWNSNGSVTINGNKITDVKAYGKLNFKNALAKSSNVAFSQIAVELGADRMIETAEALGFNKSFSLDGIPAAKSVYSVKGAQPNELGWSGVGQYTDLANPYHMMILMGAIANGGTPVLPHEIGAVTAPFGLTLKTGQAKNGDRMLETVTANRLKAYLRYDVTNAYGDGLFPGLAVCAKTGTAEVGNTKKPNCWMVGFSSNEATPYAFAVVVENETSGLRSAGQIASALMKAAAEKKT